MPRGIPGSGNGAHKAKAPGEKKGATPEQLAGLARAREARARARLQSHERSAEEESQRLADAARGFVQHTPAAPVPRYVDAQGDLDIESTKRAIALLQQTLREEEAARAERIAARGPGQSYREIDRGRIPVEIRAIQAPKMPDAMEMMDDTNPENPVPLLKPGEVGRWIRVKESLQDREDNTFRLQRYLAWGGRVLKKADGSPLRRGTLMAAALPIEANARRIIYHSSTGAFDTAQPVERLQEVAEDVNRAYGRRFHGEAARQGVLQVDGGQVTTTPVNVHPFAPED